MHAGIWAGLAGALLAVVLGVLITVAFEHSSRLDSLERTKHIHASGDSRPLYPPAWRPR